MASQTVEVEGIGTVVVARRKGMRNMRITLKDNGQVRVGIPAWMPYKAGLAFAQTRRDWILAHRSQTSLLTHLMPIGKAHHLVFLRSSTDKFRTHIVANEIRLFIPSDQSPDSRIVQSKAQTAAIKALVQEGKQLLPGRLDKLAKQHQFRYKSVTIKRLGTRWGSCNSNDEITLNCYLMQLPWHLIDYVILHELLHTQIRAHGAKFWEALTEYLPNVKELRQEIKTHRPSF